MFYLIFLSALFVLGVAVFLLNSRTPELPNSCTPELQNSKTPKLPSLGEGLGMGQSCTPALCDKCEQECMMEAATRDIEYFDDEELDAYRGRPSDQYTDDEADQFRDVLLTMRPEEVPAWGRSLRLREVNLPDQVKDDFALLATSQ